MEPGREDLDAWRSQNGDPADQDLQSSMRDAGGDAIVAISSLGARRVYHAYAAFGTAKAAIEALARYLAVEFGPDGIRTNCVAGGVVLTDLFKAIPDWEGIAAASAERAPLRAGSTPRTSPRRSCSSCRTRRGG